MPYGFDIGSGNLICSMRTAKSISYKEQSNQYIEISLEDKSFFEILKSLKVPMIEKNQIGYIFGDYAKKISNALPLIELKTTINNGILNTNNKDSYKILEILCSNLIAKNHKDIVYFSTPSRNDQNQKDIINNIFKNINIVSRGISSPLAVIYSELADQQFSGISICLGRNLIDCCFAINRNEIYHFDLDYGGDWIDKKISENTNTSLYQVNKTKKIFNLNKPPENNIEKALKLQYEFIINSIIDKIEEGINITSVDKFNIILSGGVSCLNGFYDIFKKEIVARNLNIGEIRLSKNPFNAVARGCLFAAEISLT